MCLLEQVRGHKDHCTLCSENVILGLTNMSNTCDYRIFLTDLFSHNNKVTVMTELSMGFDHCERLQRLVGNV